MAEFPAEKSKYAQLFTVLGGLLLGAGGLLPAHVRAESVAITFDDLPLNGILAPGMTQAHVVEDVLAVLKRHRVPQVYGFVNAGKLEGNADGAQALKLWIAAGERVGNHTYSHLDLHKNKSEDFFQDVRLDEPALELLDSSGAWRWLRYPYL